MLQKSILVAISLVTPIAFSNEKDSQQKIYQGESTTTSERSYPSKVVLDYQDNKPVNIIVEGLGYHSSLQQYGGNTIRLSHRPNPNFPNETIEVDIEETQDSILGKLKVISGTSLYRLDTQIKLSGKDESFISEVKAVWKQRAFIISKTTISISCANLKLAE